MANLGKMQHVSTALMENLVKWDQWDLQVRLAQKVS